MSLAERSIEPRSLAREDLVSLGYDRQSAERILKLLSQGDHLDRYLQRGWVRGCVPVTRASNIYPAQVRSRLGLDAPGCLWAKGDLSLLNTQMVSLVGSRELNEQNRQFAETAGKEAARQRITLVSGNARGADRAAQDACLGAGGSVISVVADELEKYPLREGVLYLSEDSFDLAFSGVRALSRNRVIHSLGYLTLVAQCNLGVGGTWDGTVKNLQKNWSPVYCFADGSRAAQELEQLGATPVGTLQLADFAALQPNAHSFL